MTHRRYFVASLSVLMLVAIARNGDAQVDRSRIEVGGQLATLSLRDSDGRTNTGFGGRVTYDLSPLVAVEGEMNVFVNDLLEQRSSTPEPLATLQSRDS